ncbi:MAG: ThuA domain-containing protein [Rhodothermales bacterium]|nr:ThuA domain-containing protein [Rhodothermales bacterium]
MKTLIVCITGLLLLGLSGQRASTDRPVADKKALAILGDFWHAVAPLHGAIVMQMEERGYATDIVLDYNVPFDKLAEYDLIVMSRYAVDDHRKLKEKETDSRKYGWMTPAQEEAIEAYVSNGGHLFLHHDGIGFYPKDGAISRLAKAYFIMHPPATTITVVPTGNYAGLNNGVEPFIIKDEEYKLEIDSSATNVFMQSFSPENGRFFQGWAHDYGQGKVVVFVPGHDRYTLVLPMVRRSIGNILDSFGR